MKKALLVFLALAALVSGVFTQRWLNTVSLPETAGLLETAFPDLDGKPHAVSEWKGKVLIVNFWASWCPPCVEEMPEFAKLQRELGDKGVQFVGVLIDDEADAAREFLKHSPVDYPILNGAIGGREWASSLGNKAEVLPFSVVFNQDGKPVHAQVGRFGREEVLRQVLPLLQ